MFLRRKRGKHPGDGGGVNRSPGGGRLFVANTESADSLIIT